MHDKRFSGGVERLRAQERVARLEVSRVIDLCLGGDNYRSVLDVGTGSGLFAQGFAEHGIRVTGIDANLEMLPAARTFVPDGNFLQATAEALPFANQSFELAFYGLVLHEADDPLAVLRAARQVIRSRVCVLEWPYSDQTFGPPIAHRLKPGRLEELFKQAGFNSWRCEHLENTDLYILLVRS